MQKREKMFSALGTKNLWLALVLVMGLLVSLAGCAKDEPTPAPAPEPTAPPAASALFVGEYIVNADYVKESLGKENVLLIDARGEEAANKGTIEGAIAVAWQSLAKVDGKSGDPMWGTVLEPAELGKALSSFGISQDKEIILFAAGADGWGDDGRILWELRAAGFTNLKMVDGGYAALVAAGLSTAKAPVAPTPAQVTVEKIDTKHIINTDALKADYSTFKVVDVRADEEYKGDVLYGEANGGHLPGAIHLKFTDLFNADGLLKSNDEITKMFEAKGVTKTDKVVTYCTAGIRSAYMQLVLEMCGFENTMNYDESFYRWCVENELEK